MSTNLSIQPVRTRAEKREFLHLPYRLHRQDPNWIGPLLIEESKKLNRKKHPFYEHGEGEFWIVQRDGKTVGRIAALVNDLHLEHHQDEAGHFGMVEAIDDQDVFDLLFETAENWLREKDLKRMIGPVSLSINEEIGLLVDGFETPPMILMGHAPPYYGDRFEAAGLSKAKDLHAFILDLTKPLSENFSVLVERMRERVKSTIRIIDKRNMKNDLRLATEIFNDAWAGNWGFVPLTDREMDDMAKALAPILIKEFVTYAEFEGETIAIMCAIPNINEAIRDLNGRLLPFGWLKLLWRLKVRGLTSGRVSLMGVRQSVQKTIEGSSVSPLMMADVYAAGRRKGFTKTELSWVLEDNDSIHGYFRFADVHVYKTYRVYQKEF
jgi:hypothetical protein